MAVSSKKGSPRSAGKRKNKIAAYYEVTYPERKLKRMAHDNTSVASMRKWADGYKAPSGRSASSVLVKIGKQFNLNFNQV